MAEFGDRFFLAIVGLADSGPLRPGIGRKTVVRRLGHHLQLGHRCRAQADRSSHTVVAGISAADDQHVLTFCRDKFSVFKIGIQKTLGGGFQEIHRKIDSLGIPSRRLDIPGIFRSSAEDHFVVFLQELIRFHIHAHIATGDKPDPFFFHNIDFPVNILFLQFHIRDPVHQETAYPVVSLIHRHRVSSAVQLVGRRQPRRTGADDRHFFACAYLGRSGVGISHTVGIFNNRKFIALAAHRVSVQIAGTCHLAESRTYPSGKFRKVAGLDQTVVGLFPVAQIQKVVPLRDHILQRASGHHA